MLPEWYKCFCSFQSSLCLLFLLCILPAFWLPSQSTPCPEQPLHHIILGRRPLPLHRAVLLHHLVDLIPNLVDLLHILLGHGNIRGSDGVPGCWMFCKEAIL